MLKITQHLLATLLISSFLTACAQSGEMATPELPEVIRQFIDAANAGNVEAVAATFAEDAVFDNVGRIYDGRDEIMNRFLAPEVIGLGGHYEVLSVAGGEDGRVVVEFNFTAGSLFEHFTYDFIVEDGLIQDVVGRYV